MDTTDRDSEGSPVAPQLAALRKALIIGRVSWDGDGWYAVHDGVVEDYDEAELAFAEAFAALDALERA